MKKDIYALYLLSLSIIFVILFTFSSRDLVGLSSILIVSLVIIFLGMRYPKAASILYVSLSLRILVMILGNYIALPDTTGDAYWFELKAYEWSLRGFPDVLFSIGQCEDCNVSFDKNTFGSSFIISFIIGILYSLTDRSIMMAQSLSILLGTLSVLLSWILARKLWDNGTAIKAGWFVALFPSLILYSVLIMREIYVCFFLLITFYNLVNWNHNGSLKSFFFVIFGFILGTFFHGGVFLGLLIFLIAVFLKNINKFIRKLFHSIIALKPLLAFLLIISAISFYGAKDLHIPKIGTLTDFDKIKKNILKKNVVTHRGDAKYPDWVIAKSENELIYKMPIKAMYFIFSPFPWEIKKTSHLLGMIDGFLHIFLVYLIIQNRKAIWEDPTLRIIFFILLTYLLVYGVAVGNFGTGIRHRAKFIFMFILLAAPLLPKFTFSRKIK